MKQLQNKARIASVPYFLKRENMLLDRMLSINSPQQKNGQPATNSTKLLKVSSSPPNKIILSPNNQSNSKKNEAMLNRMLSIPTPKQNNFNEKSSIITPKNQAVKPITFNTVSPKNNQPVEPPTANTVDKTLVEENQKLKSEIDTLKELVDTMKQQISSNSSFIDELQSINHGDKQKQIQFVSNGSGSASLSRCEQDSLNFSSFSFIDIKSPPHTNNNKRKTQTEIVAPYSTKINPQSAQPKRRLNQDLMKETPTVQSTQNVCKTTIDDIDQNQSMYSTTHSNGAGNQNPYKFEMSLNNSTANISQMLKSKKDLLIPMRQKEQKVNGESTVSRLYSGLPIKNNYLNKNKVFNSTINYKSSVQAVPFLSSSKNNQKVTHIVSKNQETDPIKKQFQQNKVRNNPLNKSQSGLSTSTVRGCSTCIVRGCSSSTLPTQSQTSVKTVNQLSPDVKKKVTFATSVKIRNLQTSSSYGLKPPQDSLDSLDSVNSVKLVVVQNKAVSQEKSEINVSASNIQVKESFGSGRFAATNKTKFQPILTRIRPFSYGQYAKNFLSSTNKTTKKQ